jgi:sialic acid synthase SpsE
MLKKLEFTEDEWFELADFAKDFNIIFFSKPGSVELVDLLVKLNVPAIKVGSGDLTNFSLMRRVSETNLPIIISTGMSTLEEIHDALELIDPKNYDNVALLHCTSNYPCDYTDVNLKAMLTMKKEFNHPIGYSDHTLGITVPIAAVAMGACIIEKHFTLDNNQQGPDHKSSLEPKIFKKMIQQIREIEEALGDGMKKPTESEKNMIKIARKSLVAKTDIIKGEIIKEDMLAIKRPGTGLSQQHLGKIIGKKAKKSINKDELITLEMI